MKLWYVFGKQQDVFDEVYKVWNEKEQLNERPFYSWNVDRSAQVLLLKSIMALFNSRVPVCHDSEPACTIPKFSTHSIFYFFFIILKALLYSSDYYFLNLLSNASWLIQEKQPKHSLYSAEHHPEPDCTELTVQFRHTLFRT